MTVETCGAEKRAGGKCTQVAGWGTDHLGVGRCKLHGGSTPNHQRAAEKEIARLECDRLGIPIETDPSEALIQQVWETAGNVAFYRELVQQLPTHPEPDKFITGGPDDDGEYTLAHWERGEPGVYGPTYHQSGVPTGEGKPHVLVQLYNDERKQLAAVAAAALKAGVDARRVEIEQQRASLIADVFRRVFESPALDLTPAQQRAGLQTAARQLRLVAGG